MSGEFPTERFTEHATFLPETEEESLTPSNSSFDASTLRNEEVIATASVFRDDQTSFRNCLKGSKTSHPSDPGVKNELFVYSSILKEVLEFGFDEAEIRLAYSETRGIGGVEAVINWILEHPNDSDLDSEPDESDMGNILANLQPHKMVFVVNMSLKMRAGKIAAQVGHATLGVYRSAQSVEHGQRALEAWQKIGEMKVVVKGESTKQLLDLFKQAKDLGLFVYVVADAGRTQIPAGSRTVLGIFGPSEVVDTVTRNLKLL